jgi:probable phosphoglycerate mutase
VDAPPAPQNRFAAEIRMKAWLLDQREPVIAVSHGLSGKVLRGVYADLLVDEMLQLSESQDAVVVLRGGRLDSLPASSATPSGSVGPGATAG